MKIVVGNTATAIVAADPQRTVLRLKNVTLAQTVFVAEASGVTVSTGQPIGHGAQVVIEGRSAGAAWCGVVHAGSAYVDASDR